jgi:hypothetical protein
MTGEGDARSIGAGARGPIRAMAELAMTRHLARLALAAVALAGCKISVGPWRPGAIAGKYLLRSVADHPVPASFAGSAGSGVMSDTLWLSGDGRYRRAGYLFRDTANGIEVSTVVESGIFAGEEDRVVLTQDAPVKGERVNATVSEGEIIVERASGRWTYDVLP